MPGGVFVTRIELRDPPQCTEHGGDEIEFLVSANPGQPPRPLAKVASGGELSRISLALQVATLNATHRPCLVFDEVDAGVGGAVAEMVGRQLKALAESGQVLCVTHLPQVASQADHQVRVSKRTTGGDDAHCARSAGGRCASRGTRPDARRREDHGHERASTLARCSKARGLRLFPPVRAVLAHAVAVQSQRMVADLEAQP